MNFASVLMTAATAGSGKPDADLTSWIAAVVSNGGTVSADRAAIVGGFIGAEKAAGTWALTDDYCVLWAENATQALTSLKQRRLATAVAAPTFTTDRGYAFDGSTQYIDTGFVPSTHAVAMSTDSVHAEVYERTDLSSAAGSAALGVSSGSNRLIRVQPRNSGNSLAGVNSAAATFTLPASTSLGLTQAGRSGALATTAYGAKNGVTMTRTVDPSALGASLPEHSFYIGGLNSSGTYGNGRACSVGYVAWGAALSEAQRLARYNNVLAFATAVGANV